MKVVSVVNMKGGVAKTTLAVNLAHCLATTHQKRVALLDLYPQFNATQYLMSPDSYIQHLKRGGSTIKDIFDVDEKIVASSVGGAAAISGKKFEDVSTVKIKGIDFLPGNIQLYLMEMSSGEGREFSLKQYISQVLSLKDYDYVIIDTPPTPSVWMSSALIASRYYFVPVKPDPISVVGIDMLRGIIDQRKSRMGLELDCAGLVFTIVDRPDSVIYSTTKSELAANDRWKNYVYSSYLPKRTEVAASQMEQKLILELSDTETKTKLKRITEELIARVA